MQLGMALQKLRGKSFQEMLAKGTSILRGFIVARKLQSRTVISVRGPLKIIKVNGDISIGGHTELWPEVKLSCFGRQKAKPAAIVIGKRCSLGDRTEIHAGKRVEIGNDVIIAWDCVIMDRDYHSTDGSDEVCETVTIKDGVWIGCRAIILKGVTIGEGSVVGAGSVVTKSVAPFHLVAGNPARVIKKVSGWKGPAPFCNRISQVPES
jgi:acetyltransferase-like isoleucine patch superfamily enzyme